MSIVAALDQVLFFNTASKYTVMRLKTADIMIPDEARRPSYKRDHLTRFVAVGYDLPQTSAISMELDGSWEKGKYGLQFQVEQWREVIPPTIEGIRGYLRSGLLKGIGEKTADAIVQRFGLQSLSVLENEPDRLLEIRGITPERLEEIKSGYAESKMLRELMTVLAPFKVTPATAMRIYEHFGPGGVKLIQRSPFRLCQVPGFGFRRVDAIVQKSGGNLHDPMRIQGALFYALEQARSEGGHLYLEAEKMIRDTLQLLNEKIPYPDQQLKQPQIAQELQTMILSDVVVSNNGNIYLPHVFKQESETARKAVKMSLQAPDPVNLLGAMAQIKDQQGLVLTDRQREGVEMAFRNNLSIITGGPGTGKSTILKAVIDVFRMLYPKKTLMLGAPTGKASRRMAETTGINSAQTLHSILNLHGEESGWKKKTMLETDLLIVDETSMMDMWLTHQLFMRLKPSTKVLLVGDADQLESVGAGRVLQELIESGVVPVTVLNEVFRQGKDSLIHLNAIKVNQGQMNLEFGEDFRFINADTQEEAAEKIRGIFREEARIWGISNVQILSPFRSNGAASTQALNEAIREEVNPPRAEKPEVVCNGRMFRLGDKVMQTRNNYELLLRDREGGIASVGAFNGEVGRICRMEPGKVTVDYDGRYAEYSRDSLNELELSYASTVHKSQGGESDVIILPMLTAHRVLLTRSVFYTAMTRARRRVILVGQRKALYMAIGRSVRGKRNTLLGERMRQYYGAFTGQNENQMKQAS